MEIFIKGENFSAFVTGVKDDCEHDENGGWLSFDNDGNYYKESELTDEILPKISGGCVSCSKCGKPFTPDFFDF